MTDETLPPVGDDHPVDAVKIRDQIKRELSAEFEAEKQKILGNKNEILEEYKQFREKFKGIDDGLIEEAQRFKEQKEKDEVTRLLAEGQTEQVIERLTKAQREEWNKELSTYEERLQAVSKEKESVAEQLEELRNKNVTMQKNQYLKDLVTTDDSFKRESLAEFIELYGKRLKIDEETGAAYAVGEDGRPMVDPHTGEIVPFNQFYAKRKTESGLFWNGGAGSGLKGDGGNGTDHKKLKDMTPMERLRWKKEAGITDAQYEKILRESFSK